ncbi:hypothetical protein NKG05_19960 [Oerskovia sp. M15]
MFVDGSPVSNLFVYDASGRALQDVQIFDDLGRPVRTITSEGATQPWALRTSSRAGTSSRRSRPTGASAGTSTRCAVCPKTRSSGTAPRGPCRSRASSLGPCRPLPPGAAAVGAVVGRLRSGCGSRHGDEPCCPGCSRPPVGDQAPVDPTPEGSTAPSARTPGTLSPTAATPVIEASRDAAPSGG